MDARELDVPRRFDADALLDASTAVLTASGVPEPDARIVAESLVDADLRGIHSHGVSRLGIYRTRLLEGGNRTTSDIEVVADHPASALLDARDCLSQLVSARAVDLALEKARSTGVGAIAVRGGSHFGAAGYWARAIAEGGCVGLVTTNTTPLMVPWGGTEAKIGTNPIALAFPSVDDEHVVVDLATSETTWGALVNAANADQTVPDTWALGADGSPTTSAREAVDARRLLPFGRHKGYALAVGIELLAGALAGAACLDQITDMYGEPDRPMRAGHLFLAVSPPAPDGADGLGRLVAWTKQRLQAVPARPDVDEVRWPGQIESELAAERRRHGVPLPEPVAAELDRHLSELDLPPLPAQA